MHSSSLRNIERKAISKGLAFLAMAFFSICTSGTLSWTASQVFAEIDAVKLNEVLTQLGGDIPATSTGKTSTGSTWKTNSGTTSSGATTVKTATSTGSNTKTTPITSNSGTTRYPTDSRTVESPITSPFAPSHSTSADPTSSYGRNETSNYGEPSLQVLKVEKGDARVTVTFSVTGEVSLIRKFQFDYVDFEGNTKTALTYEKERIRDNTGNYRWYIPNLGFGKYTFTIKGIDATGETIPGLVSKSFDADLSLRSAEKCVIPDVSGLSSEYRDTKSILSWDRIPEAKEYRLYRKDKNGRFVFIDSAPTNTYTINSSGPVRYEEYSVKGVCSDGNESAGFSPSTSVKTGPAGLIVLLLVSVGIGYVLVWRKKMAK